MAEFTMADIIAGMTGAPGPVYEGKPVFPSWADIVGQAHNLPFPANYGLPMLSSTIGAAMLPGDVLSGRTEADLTNPEYRDRALDLAGLMVGSGPGGSGKAGSGAAYRQGFGEQMAAGKERALRESNAPAYTTARAPVVEPDPKPLLRSGETRGDVARAMGAEPIEPSVADVGRDAYRAALGHLDDLSKGFTLGSGSKKAAPAVVAAKLKPTTEMTPIGEQYVLPGAEQRPKGEVLQRLADEKLKPTVAQKPADEGLFAGPEKQTGFDFDLGSGSKRASPAIAALKAAQEPAGPITGVGGRYRPPPVVPTVDNPQRIVNPMIYGNPKDIAAIALGRVAPEHPALKELFDVSRGDLADIALARKGNLDPYTLLPGWKPGATGSAAAEAIANPRNAQRLIDTLAEAMKIPELRNTVGWYVMDPAYQRLVGLVGPERAKALYTPSNAITGMASPGSAVEMELLRGTAASMAANQGKFNIFERFGGLEPEKRPPRAQRLLGDMPGHKYHKTSQGPQMERYVEGGDVDLQSPKVPLYIGSSGVPQTGFQTGLPVADVHFAGGAGLWDTRTAKDFRKSLPMREFQVVGPWYAEKVAKPLGLEAGYAQPLQWTTFGPQTDVRSLLGAPKLELLAQKVWEKAAKDGLDPHRLLDLVLTRKAHLSSPLR